MASIALISCARVPVARSGDIVSLDYCADQLVTSLLDRSRIAAVSHEADSDQLVSQRNSVGIPRVRVRLEDIVALRPKYVVRSYAGSPALLSQLQRLNIVIVDLGYADDPISARKNLSDAAQKLGASVRSQDLLGSLDSVNTQMRPTTTTALYMTPGNVTAGSGTMIDALLKSAGYTNVETRSGWHPLPLESMVLQKPDHIVTGFFDDPRHGQDRWSSSRHKVMRQIMAQTPRTDIPGSYVACNNHLFVRAKAMLDDRS